MKIGTAHQPINYNPAPLGKDAGFLTHSVLALLAATLGGGLALGLAARSLALRCLTLA